MTGGLFLFPLLQREPPKALRVGQIARSAGRRTSLEAIGRSEIPYTDPLGRNRAPQGPRSGATASADGLRAIRNRGRSGGGGGARGRTQQLRAFPAGMESRDPTPQRERQRQRSSDWIRRTRGR